MSKSKNGDTGTCPAPCYVVEVNNEIVGNSTRKMTKEEIKGFNFCALQLSDDVDKDGQPHSSGMWTVKKHNV